MDSSLRVEPVSFTSAAIRSACALLAQHSSRERAHSTEPNVDVGGVVEFYTRRGLILRLDIADSIVRYGRRTVHISDVLPAIQAGGFTAHNLQVSFGVGIRFPK